MYWVYICNYEFGGSIGQCSFSTNQCQYINIYQSFHLQSSIRKTSKKPRHLYTLKLISNVQKTPSTQPRPVVKPETVTNGGFVSHVRKRIPSASKDCALYFLCSLAKDKTKSNGSERYSSSVEGIQEIVEWLVFFGIPKFKETPRCFFWFIGIHFNCTNRVCVCHHHHHHILGHPHDHSHCFSVKISWCDVAVLNPSCYFWMFHPSTPHTYLHVQPQHPRRFHKVLNASICATAPWRSWVGSPKVWTPSQKGTAFS